TVLEPLGGTDEAWAAERYREMQREIEAILPPVGAATTHRAADLRYLGQEHTVTVPAGEPGDWPAPRGRFDEAHRRAYGYPPPPASGAPAPRGGGPPTPRGPRGLLPPARRGRPGRPGPAARGVVVGRGKIPSSPAGEAVGSRVSARGGGGAGGFIAGPASIEE